MKGCFLTHIKTARFIASLIVLGKLEVYAGLQIYPKNILRRTNKAYKALENGAPDALISRIVRHIRHEGAYSGKLYKA